MLNYSRQNINRIESQYYFDGLKMDRLLTKYGNNNYTNFRYH